MEIQVNMPYFGYLLNYLNANFTSFELLEFQNISGKYAKTLYRLLKQWKISWYFKVIISYAPKSI